MKKDQSHTDDEALQGEVQIPAAEALSNWVSEWRWSRSLILSFLCKTRLLASLGFPRIDLYQAGFSSVIGYI